MLLDFDRDQRITFSNGIMFYKALRRRHVRVYLFMRPEQGHCPMGPAMIQKTMQTNMEWFEKYTGLKKSF